LATKYNMDKSALKDLVYGGIRELINNRDFYHYSSVGSSYSGWTEDGIKALNEYMNGMGWMIMKAEIEDLDARAKELILNTLKGDNTTSE